MKKTLSLIVFVFIITNSLFSQIGTYIPIEQRVDWRNAGYPGDIPTYFENYIESSSYGSLQEAIEAANTYNIAPGHEKHRTLIHIPTGEYRFSGPITLHSRICLRGDGAANTILYNTSVNGPFIKVEATNTPAPSSPGVNPNTDVFKNLLRNDYDSNSKILTIRKDPNPPPFKIGDFIEIIVKNNPAWHGYPSDPWDPQYYVGQIVRIAGVNDENHYILADDIKLTLDAYPDSAYYRKLKLNTIEDVGIEDLYMKPQANDQTNNNNYEIRFSYAANCWISGVMSEYPSTSHVDIEYSTGIEIRGCYFHDAQSFTEDGNGYGIVINCHSTNCLIEDNIFRRLRHAMVVTTGANRNVFGYNYSSERIQTELGETTEFNNRMADLVCHGHYPYANLFEGNVCDFISVDDSHANRLNGDFNTFFRNRVLADLTYFLGNKVSYGGIETKNGHQNIYGNTLQDIEDQDYVRGTYSNFNGQINTQTGDATYSDISYYYESQPAFLSGYTWPALGTRTPWGSNYGITSNRNPARDRFYAPSLPEAFNNVKSRGNIYSLTLTLPQTPENGQLLTGSSSTYYTINGQNLSGIVGLANTVVTLNAIAPANTSFLEWSDGNTSNPRSFTITGNSTIYAKFKKLLISDTRNAFSNSSQRKFIRTSDGVYHLVYESMGKIWYERSTDGTNWTIGNNGKPLNTDYVYTGLVQYTGTGSYTVAKSPSLDSYQNWIFVTWEEQSGSGYVIRVTGLGNTSNGIGVLLGPAKSLSII